MVNRWYCTAVIYSLDVRTFQDSNGDGVGDFAGIVSRLDHLERLGVTTLWLNPIQPSPDRDGGYDITDYYAVDPRFGALGDFADFMDQCEQRGLRVVLDLVLNHTSIEHPWFVEARDPDSPRHDWYVWSTVEPKDRHQGMVFPGAQKETWTYDRKARAYYYHRFYDFEPDLDITNPAVRAEMLRIVGFWARLGVSGFRIDAVPFVVENTSPAQRGSRRAPTTTASIPTYATASRGNTVTSCCSVRRMSRAKNSCASSELVPVTATARLIASRCSSRSTSMRR